jgi:NAD(P)-dependent dehydrogenase (short-subunit alcohol dehydrogenase family)
MPFTIDYTDAVVAITGVTSGIGQGIARMFARAGAHVAGCGRSTPDSEGAQRFREIVTEERPAHLTAEPLYVSCDIAEKDGPVTFVDAVVDRFGGIDSVISNAGRNVFTGVDGTTVGQWEECMNLDLRSHWLLAQAAKNALHSDMPASGPTRRRTRPPDLGRPTFLINSSNHAVYTIPGCFPYNVAKAGLNGLVQSLAIEWGPTVRAVGVAPGFVETAGNREWFARFDSPDAERRRTEMMHPSGTLGTVDQIGATFLFLASRYADFVTGTTWLVDGGRSALMQDGSKEYRFDDRASCS